MNKHRIHTTISPKHWELLQKHTEKYETQQKALEAALESLESGPKQNTALSSEDQLWVSQMVRVRGMISIAHRDLFAEFIKTSDTERIINSMMKLEVSRYVLESYYHKPLKKCSLKEIIEGMVIMGKIVNWFDSIDYIEDRDFYMLRIIQSMGINNSKINRALYEDLFERCGVKTETEMTETSLFIKVFKDTEGK